MEYDTPLGGLWGLVTIVGPLLFLAVLAWVIFRNRKVTPREDRVSEESAVNLREQLTAERKEREGDTSGS